MSKQIFGKFPLTTVIGALIAGLMVVDEMTKAGETSWLRIGVAVAIAALGRFSADAGSTKKEQK